MAHTPKKVRMLSREEVARLRDQLMASAKPEEAQGFEVLTQVHLPLGELLNPEMGELLKTWLKTCSWTTGSITPQHRFCAQGIEGLVKIEPIPLYMALLAADTTGIYRIAIFVPCGWTCSALQGSSHFQKKCVSEQEQIDAEVDA